MASLGQELRRERELRGISLQDIADSTRISLRFLQAIEEDHLDCLPGAFFVRAILRSYAKSIGIDENQILNRYREIRVFEEHQQEREFEGMKRRRQALPLFSRRRIRFAVTVIAVFPIGLGLLYLLVLTPGKRLSTLQETDLPASNRLEIPESPPPLEAAINERQGLRLRIDFDEETWLQIYADGKSVWDGTKAMGESLEVTAEQEVVLTVGNAGGCGLTINGQKAKPLGPRGAVRQDIRITSENYLDFLVSEVPEES